MTQKIRYASSGDRLSARYVNQIVDAANLAISVLGPPRSKRQPSADSKPIDLDDNGDGTVDLGTRVYTESSRTTTLVRVEQADDPDVYVEIDRIDSVTLVASDDTIQLVFDNS